MRRAVSQSVARGMAYSVGCSESLPFISEADIRRETAGNLPGGLRCENLQKNCGICPRQRVKGFPEAGHSDVPALLITGAEDPATPPSMAEHAAEGLSHSRIVVIPHGTHLTASQCIDNMIVQFVNQGSGSGIDTACVSQIRGVRSSQPTTSASFWLFRAPIPSRDRQEALQYCSGLLNAPFRSRLS